MRVVVTVLLLALCALTGCAMLEAFVRGAGEAAGVTVPSDPLSTVDYFTVIGGIAAAVLSGGWAGLKLSAKFGKAAKVAQILSEGLYQAKRCATTERIDAITDAVGAAAQNAGVKEFIDKIYDSTKAKDEEENGGDAYADPMNPTPTVGPGTDN